MATRSCASSDEAVTIEAPTSADGPTAPGRREATTDERMLSVQETVNGSPLLTRAENLERAQSLLAHLAANVQPSVHPSTTAALHLALAGHQLRFGCCSSRAVAAVKEAA